MKTIVAAENDLFGAAPNVARMYVIDASVDGLVRFQCEKCERETDWIDIDTDMEVEDARRGIPCRSCNE